MAKLQHSGGLVEAVLELGFDGVKYFEGTITDTASGFTISPPARRLTILNKSTTDAVFLRVNGSPATTSVSFTPGDNIKIGPECSFNMDFDTLGEISFVTNGASVDIEGLIGFKATAIC